MSWMDSVREEMNRRQARDARPESRDPSPTATEESVQRAATLVRGMLEQMNETLLAGRGSVWDTPVSSDLRLWELWWGPAREEGTYLFVTLLRDSGGTPYVKVETRRIALADARFERRLQYALSAAFLAPRTYQPRQRQQVGRGERLQARAGTGRRESRRAGLLPAESGTQPNGGTPDGAAAATAPQKRRRQRTGRNGG